MKLTRVTWLRVFKHSLNQCFLFLTVKQAEIDPTRVRAAAGGEEACQELGLGPGVRCARRRAKMRPYAFFPFGMALKFYL